MTSTAPAKTAMAPMTHGGGYTALVKLLAQEVVNAADPSPERASNVLSVLGASQGDDAAAVVPPVTVPRRHCRRRRVWRRLCRRPCPSTSQPPSSPFDCGLLSFAGEDHPFWCLN